MSEEPTIIFELTPKEAAILSEMLGAYSWNKGPYGQLVCEMYWALNDVCQAFEHIDSPDTVTEFGLLGDDSIWLDDYCPKSRSTSS